MLYKLLVIFGCTSIMLAGLYQAVKLQNIGAAIANICIGIANLIFMLRA